MVYVLVQDILFSYLIMANLVNLFQVHFERDQFHPSKDQRAPRLKGHAVPTTFAHRPPVARRRSPLMRECVEDPESTAEQPESADEQPESGDEHLESGDEAAESSSQQPQPIPISTDHVYAMHTLDESPSSDQVEPVGDSLA